MRAEQAIRFLHHEAARCRDRDEAEAICLLMPALLKFLTLKPMHDFESEAFREELRKRFSPAQEPKPEAIRQIVRAMLNEYPL
jgi:hypothetical protein